MSDNDVTSFGATSYLYLNGTIFDRNGSLMQTTYPSSYDTINRLGKTYHGVHANLQSSVNPVIMTNSDIIEVKIDNPFSHSFENYRIQNMGVVNVYLADLYFYLYDNVDFTVKCYDEENKEISSAFSLERETLSANFKHPASISEMFKDPEMTPESKLRENDLLTTIECSTYRDPKNSAEDIEMPETRRRVKYQKLHIIGDDIAHVKSAKLFIGEFEYFTEEFDNSEKTINLLKVMEAHRSLPIKFYDLNDREIKTGKIRYQRLYTKDHRDINTDQYIGSSFDKEYSKYYETYSTADTNILSIEFNDNKNILQECRKIGFAIGVDIQRQTTNIKYFNYYLGAEITFPRNKVDALNKWLYLGKNELDANEVMCIDDTMKLHTLIKLKDEDDIIVDLVDPIKLHLVPMNLLKQRIQLSPSDFTTIFRYCTFHAKSTNGLLIIQKTQLIDDSTRKRFYDVDMPIVEIKDSRGNNVEILSYSWGITTITVNIVNDIDDRITIKLKQSAMTINKLDLVSTSFAYVENIDLKMYIPRLYLYEGETSRFNDFDFISNDYDLMVFLKYDPDWSKDLHLDVYDLNQIYKFNVTLQNFFDKYLSIENIKAKGVDGYEESLGSVRLVLSSTNSKYDLVSSVFVVPTFNRSSNQFEPTYQRDNKIDVEFDEVKERERYDVLLAEGYIKGDYRKAIAFPGLQITVDGSLSTRIEGLDFTSPKIHYYGYIIDSLGNRIKDTPGIKDSYATSFYSNVTFNGDPSNNWGSDIVNEKMLVVNPDSRTLDYSYKNYYQIMKPTEIEPIGVKLTSKTENLVLDSSQDPIYCYYDGDELITDDNWYGIDYFPYDRPDVFISGYHHNRFTKYEINNGYDFYFVENVGKSRRSVLPGEYSAQLMIGSSIISDLSDITFSRSSEEASRYYGRSIAWPYVNVVGKVQNSARDRVVHRSGMSVRFTNLATDEVSEFKYKCSDDSYEGLCREKSFLSSDYISLYSEDTQSIVRADGSRGYNYYENAWDEHFRFLYSGNDSPLIMWKKGIGINNQQDVRNADIIRSEKSLKPGDYKVELLLNDSLISTYFDNESPLHVALSRQASLYDLNLEFPWCTVSGRVIDSQDIVVFGNSWKVEFVSRDDNEDVHSYTLRRKDIYSDNYCSSFIFDGFGTYRDFSIPATINTSGYCKDYAEPGIPPGDYIAMIKYNDTLIQSSEISISKEAEAAGRLDIDFRIESIFTTLSAAITNIQYPDEENVGATYRMKLSEYYDGEKIGEHILTSENGVFVQPNMSRISDYAIEVSAIFNHSDEFDPFAEVTVHEIQITDAYDAIGDKSVFEDGKMILSSAEMTGVTSAIKLFAPYLYQSISRMYLYKDAHAIIDNWKAVVPRFDMNLTIRNKSLDEETTLLSANSVFGQRQYYLENFDNRSIEMKTGEYEVSLTRVCDDEIIFKDEFSLTQAVPMLSPLSSLLGCKTLNFNVLTWRDDIKRYQPINPDSVSIEVLKKNNDAFIKYYDRTIVAASDYYFEENDPTFENPVVSAFGLITISGEQHAWQNDYTVMKYEANIAQSKKCLLAMPVSGDVKLNVWLGERNNESKVSSIMLFDMDLSRSYDSLVNPLPKVGFHEWNERRYAPPADAFKFYPVTLSGIIDAYVIPQVTALPAQSNLLYNMIDSFTANERTASVKLDSTYDQTQLSILETALASSVNEVTDGQISNERAISSFTGRLSGLITDKIVDGVINVDFIEERTPTEYHSLVIDEYMVNKTFKLKVHDVIDNEDHYSDYDPFSRCLAFRLEIRDDANELEHVFYSIKNEIEIMNVRNGWHTFALKCNDFEILRKRVFLYSNDDEDLVFEGTVFEKNYLSGIVTVNGATSINDIHVKLDYSPISNPAVSSVYYGSEFPMFATEHYGSSPLLDFQRSRFDYMSEKTEGWRPQFPISTPNFDRGPEGSVYPRPYSSKFGGLHLYDLLPGNYNLRLYAMPEVNDNYDKIGEANPRYVNMGWSDKGDSYFYDVYFDNSLSGQEHHQGSFDNVRAGAAKFEDLSSLISKGHAFTVPLSSIQYNGTEKIISDVDAADERWDVMDVIIEFGMSFNKFEKTEYYYEDGFAEKTEKKIRCIMFKDINSQYCLCQRYYGWDEYSVDPIFNRKSLAFTSRKVNNRSEIEITLKDDLSEWREFGSIIELKLRSLRILFGQKIYEGPFSPNAFNSLNITGYNEYTQHIIATLSGYDQYAYDKVGSFDAERNGASIGLTKYQMKPGVVSQLFGLRSEMTTLNWRGDFGNGDKLLGTSQKKFDKTNEMVSVSPIPQNRLQVHFVDTALKMNNVSCELSGTVSALLYYKKDETNAQLNDPAIMKFERSSSSDAIETSFNHLFDGEYQIGAIFNDYRLGDDIAEIGTDNPHWRKKYLFNEDVCISGCGPYNLTSSSRIEIGFATQNVNVVINAVDDKTGEYVQGMPLRLVRSQSTIDATDTFDKSYEVTSYEKVKTGYFSSISYESVTVNGTPITISYAPQVIGEDRTFILHRNVNELFNVGVQVLRNGVALPNTQVDIYDADRNLYSSFTTNGAGIMRFNIYTIPLRAKIANYDYSDVFRFDQSQQLIEVSF